MIIFSVFFVSLNMAKFRFVLTFSVLASFACLGFSLSLIINNFLRSIFEEVLIEEWMDWSISIIVTITLLVFGIVFIKRIEQSKHKAIAMKSGGKGS